MKKIRFKETQIVYILKQQLKPNVSYSMDFIRVANGP